MSTEKSARQRAAELAEIVVALQRDSEVGVHDEHAGAYGECEPCSERRNLLAALLAKVTGEVAA